MPYYEEVFLNESRKGSAGSTPVLVATDAAKVISFRTRPHPRAITSKEIDPKTVDPYAYFLESNSRRKYQALLKERGLQPEGSPDRGHAFEVQRHSVVGYGFPVVRGGSNPTLWENAAIMNTSAINALSIHPGSVTVPVTSFNRDELRSFGQLAYNRSAPSSVVFDAANFLGELREGLPRLASETVKNASKFYRGIGSDYLNVAFGWLPFVSDLQNAGKALLGATQQLARNGERVHRRYGVPPTFNSQFSNTGAALISVGVGNRGFGYVPPGYLSPNGTANSSVGSSAWYGRAYQSKTVEIHRWFEGSFSSFYPLGFDPTDYLSRLDQLVNRKITPETLWNLSPWSWLVDWNLKLGDSIAANQKAANDLLVMHYGYAMEKRVYKTYSSVTLDPYKSGINPNASWAYLPPSVSMVGKTEIKRRIRANPYGFSVASPTGFNPGQLAILAALGLTRLK